MRVAAVGWLAADADEAHDLALTQARVSHDHPDAVAAAQAVARAILAFRGGASAADIRTEMGGKFGYDLGHGGALSGGEPDVYAAGTTPAALAAALEAGDWAGAVRTAAGPGGDTDTLACIAGAVAEVRFGVPPEIGAVRGASSRQTLERYSHASSAG